MFINNNLINFYNAWEQCKVDDLIKEASEGGTPTTNKNEYYDNGNIPFVKIENTQSKYIDRVENYITHLGLEKSSAWIVPVNSLIYTNGATVGNSSINRIETATKQGILGIIPSDIIDVEFMYYLVNTAGFKKEVEKRTAKGTFDTIILKNFKDIPSLITKDKKEQNRISDLLSSVDNLITLHQ